jgi:hypothetical protein
MAMGLISDSWLPDTCVHADRAHQSVTMALDAKVLTLAMRPASTLAMASGINLPAGDG